MAKRRFFSAVGLGAIAAVSVAVLALGGCEERPYPAPSHTAPPAAHPSADLMGAPSSPYTAPPVTDAPAYPASPAYSPPAYDNGSVVAMAPIPNPGPTAGGAYDDGRVHARYPAASPYGEGHWAPGRRPTTSAHAPPRPHNVAPPVLAPPVVAKPPPAQQTVAKTAPAPATKTPVVQPAQHKAPALPATVGVAAGAAALEAHHAAVVANPAATTSTTTTTTTKTAAPPASAPVPAPAAGDQNARLVALQTALTDAIGKTAVLTTPASFTANQPTDVALTIPAAFADTLKGEAQKDGMADEAASVSLAALLSGDGFAVTPSDEQSVTLKSGQPTEFHWTVTAEPNAKGPLHADVSANLLGGANEKLALGSVQKAAGEGVKLSPRIVGAALLILITALVVAWLARGRGPSRSASARRASRQAARGGRPFDMSGSDAP